MRLWGTIAHQSKLCLQLVSQGVPLPSHNFHLMPFGADAFLLDAEIPFSLVPIGEYHFESQQYCLYLCI